MTLAEIEEAGIDVNDPANQNVYKFTIRLAFINEPVEVKCDINGAGEFVGDCSIGGGGGGGGGGGLLLRGRLSIGGGGASYEAIPVVVEGHPLIQWLVLEGSVTTLEAVRVAEDDDPEPLRRTVHDRPGQSHAALPEGLSLAPTAVPQSLTQTLPTI